MLQTIRDRLTTGIFAFVVVIIIALAFIFWGVDPGTGAQPSVASVNGEEVSMTEVRRSYQLMLNQVGQNYADGIPESLQQRVKNMVIENAVRDSLLTQKSKQSGYRVGNDQLRRRIGENPQFQRDGAFSVDAYEFGVAQLGFSTAQYENRFREALTVEQLQNGVSRTAFVTTSELQRLVALEKQQRDIAYVRVPAARFSADATIDETVLAMRYEDNQAAYVTPATVDIEYLEVRYDDFASGIEVSAADVQREYAEQVDAGLMQSDEKRLARHILLAVGADDEAEKLAEANALLARLSAGEDFAEIAQAHSDDPGSKTEGGLLDWADRKVFVGAFTDALFGLEVGQLAGPVRTQFGYHIIRLEEIQAEAVKTFEEAQADLLAALQQRAADQQFYNHADEIDRAVYEASDELNSTAERFGLQIGRVNGVTASLGGGIASNPKVREAAFKPRLLEDGENSDAIQIDTGHYVYLRVAAHTPARQQTLDEVRDQLVRQLQAEAAQEEARQLGGRILARLKAGETLDALATEFELTAENKGFVGRNAVAVPAALLTAAFKLNKPTGEMPAADGVTLTGGDYAVFEVRAVQDGSETGAAEAQQFAGQIGLGDFAAYVAEIREDAKIQLRPERLE